MGRNRRLRFATCRLRRGDERLRASHRLAVREHFRAQPGANRFWTRAGKTRGAGGGRRSNRIAATRVAKLSRRALWKKSSRRRNPGLVLGEKGRFAGGRRGGGIGRMAAGSGGLSETGGFAATAAHFA